MTPFDQNIHDWFSSLSWTAEAGLRLALAAGAGALVGLEREIRGREAGFRTNILVCLGSALVMIVSKHFAETNWTAIAHANINVDPARIAYGVMTGVGFLGAGAILHHKGSVRGLTTAAALWCVAAIGLAAGFGLYGLTIVSVSMILLVLWLLTYFERVLPHRQYRLVTLRCKWRPGCIEAVLARFPEHHVHISDHTYQRIGDLSEVEVDIWLTYRQGASYRQVEDRLANDPDVTLVGVRMQ